MLAFRRAVNCPDGDVSVIDVATNQVTKKIPVGRRPWGLAVVALSPDMKETPK